MRKHPKIGADVLMAAGKRLGAAGERMFAHAMDIALYYHEKFDGSGYPHGLVGDAIPLSARIVAVADVFDSLTSARPCKPAWSIEEAVEQLEAGRGSINTRIRPGFEGSVPHKLRRGCRRASRPSRHGRGGPASRWATA